MTPEQAAHETRDPTVFLPAKFMTDRSKIRGQKLAGVSVQEQRDIANAIKNAREMALLPYTKRTVSTRAPRASFNGSRHVCIMSHDIASPCACCFAMARHASRS